MGQLTICPECDPKDPSQPHPPCIPRSRPKTAPEDDTPQPKKLLKPKTRFSITK